MVSICCLFIFVTKERIGKNLNETSFEFWCILCEVTKFLTIKKKVFCDIFCEYLSRKITFLSKKEIRDRYYDALITMMIDTTFIAKASFETLKS